MEALIYQRECQYLYIPHLIMSPLILVDQHAIKIIYYTALNAGIIYTHVRASLMPTRNRTATGGAGGMPKKGDKQAPPEAVQGAEQEPEVREGEVSVAIRRRLLARQDELYTWRVFILARVPVPQDHTHC